MRICIIAAIVAIMPAIAPPLQAREAGDGRLCHIANAGFFVSDGKRGILVDAVLGDPYPPYHHPSDDLNARIEASAGPFADVNLVLATHFHGDHFDARAMLRHLRANAQARYVVTPQAASQLDDAGLTEGEADRVMAVHPPAGQPLETSFHDIPLRVWRVSHGANRPIDNLGFEFEIAGKRFFHPGDMSMTADELAAYGLDNLAVDFLLAPFWLLLDEDNLAMLNRAFDARRIVPMHMLDQEAASEADWVANAGGWDAVRQRYLNATANTVDLFGEMACMALPD